MQDKKALYEFIERYISLINEDGTEYKPPVEGSGRRKPEHKVERIPST